jgi:hypothetical protein
MRWSILLVAALSTSAFAESTLYKCVINGRVTYTDLPPSNCQPVTRGTLAAPSPKQRKVIIDGAAYDQQTAREIMRYRQSKAAANIPAVEPEAPVPRQAERPQVDLRRFEGRGRAGRNEARVAAGLPQLEDNAVPVVTGCNSGGCYDNMGRYHSGNPGGTMNSPDGKVCRKSGGVLVCD